MKSDTKKMAGENSDTKDGSKKLVRQEHKKMTKQWHTQKYGKDGWLEKKKKKKKRKKKKKNFCGSKVNG